ncbi:ArsR family transcriptional regulator [Hasllibacter halocynthiae]|uniref:ArsR family transcriptional regulator n=1 Tax=Hasllibacter halocynthiae TaxID=595589 RepID=A0A2T0X9Y2_9RHOB|nr:metalloregulator ArsR/SmtB family transcription factor [Hasllibacter halocynthiae]PRY95694.1 ArsR family transcriptional regulator [Hasllibacter halocynthiae]
MTDGQAAAVLGALADPTRLAMLRHLVRAGPEGAAAGTSAEAVGATPSRASFHLKALERAGLVTCRRDGRSMIYAARMDALGAVISHIVDDCCAGSPALRACCR